MISKNVKRKRRLNKEVLENIANISLYLADRRCDFWIVSIKKSPSKSEHFEIYGGVKALNLYKQQVFLIRSNF